MSINAGRMNRYVSLSQKPQVTNDADGYWEPLNPTNAWCRLQPVPPGTGDGRAILHQVTMRFHPQVTMDTKLTYYDEVLLRDRDLLVMGVQNVDDRNAELQLLCEEIQP
jgi:head-tail adaptor